jgi:hypothetical protein
MAGISHHFAWRSKRGLTKPTMIGRIVQEVGTLGLPLGGGEAL